MSRSCQGKMSQRLRNTLILLMFFMGQSFLVSAEPVETKLLEFWNDVEPNSRLKVNHSVWQSMLDKYLDDQDPSGINRFDYNGVSDQDREALKDYVEFLQNYDPRQFNLQEQKAYWLNLYNATIVSLILQEKPDNSIREVRTGFSAGPWKRRVFEIATKKLSLNDVENGIIRPIIKDPRIHYALNSGSLSCPNLIKQAYSGENVEALLDQAARSYINHKRGVSVAGSEANVSSIYDWYRNDFGDVMSHLKEYAEPDLAAALVNVSDLKYGYDWDLNKP